MTEFFGTGADDTIYGTDGGDSLYGLEGNDQLRSKKGNDHLYGGAGNDSLNGGAGADTIFGGSGDDTYYVDDPADIVSEETVLGVDDGGKDRVYSSITFTLGHFLERLTLSGSAAIDGTGNELANRIAGNAAANVLAGAGGNDTLIGDAGDDRLIGGAGKDALTGGLGADTFVLGRADASSTDNVTDFTAEDRVEVVANDYSLAVGNGLVKDSTGRLLLDPDYFATVSGSTSVQGTAPHGQFVYNTTTRTLMWDADGSGTSSSGIALAIFNSGVVLSAANIAVTGATAGTGDISIGDVTIAEGNSGTSTATFTVTRTGTAAFSLDYATANGTATADDYVAKSGTLTFAAGQATQSITVAINGDTTIEGNETFFVNLTNPSNGVTIADGQGLGTILNDDQAAPVVGDISINDITIAEGNSGTKTATFTVSRTGSAAFTVSFATADGTAKAGSDYAATSGTLSFSAGEATKTVSVTITGDTTVEANETFFLNLTKPSNGGTIVDGQGLGTITNDDAAPNPTPTAPKVVAVHDTTKLGSPDANGLVYVPSLDTLFLSDSELDESWFGGKNNLLALTLDGRLKQAISLLGFTTEPTGLTFDPKSGHMFISDDDKYKIYTVDPANPTAKLSEFLVKPLGSDDTEDVTFNPNNGHVLINNGGDYGHGGIIETNISGTQLISTMHTSSPISNPEGAVYDPAHDVFFMGGNNSHIYMVNHSGTVLKDINILANYPNPINGANVNVQGMTLAPSSDPNDGDQLSLYVGDAGKWHVNDGRLFEINLGDVFLV